LLHKAILCQLQIIVNTFVTSWPIRQGNTPCSSWSTYVCSYGKFDIVVPILLFFIWKCRKCTFVHHMGI